MIKFDFSTVLVPFGRWKGCTIEEIESSYLIWLVENCADDHIQNAAEQELQWRTDNNAHFYD